MDYIGGVVAGQLFQSPYAFARGDEHLRPLVFGSPLQRSGSRLVGRIRPGLRFSDGSLVGPGDVVASLRKVWSRGRPVRLREEPGAVVFELASSEAAGELEATLVTSWSAISKGGDGRTGSGAYLLASDSNPERVRLRRNPHYGGQQGAAAIAEIELRCFTPAVPGRNTELLAALEAGEIDFTQVLSRDEAAGLKRARKLYQPGSSTAILYLNCDRLAPELRGAIVRTLDRYALTSACYDNPAGFVARGLLPPRMGSYSDEVTRAPAPRELFAGRPPLRLLLVWAPRPYLSRPREVADKLVEQLSAAGLAAEIITTRDAEDYFGRLHAGDYDAVLSGWIADSSEPREFLHSILHSRSMLDPGGSNPSAANLARWSDARADELLAAIGEGGQGRHCEHTAALVRHVGQQAPLLPLMYGPSVTVLSRRVRSFELHPLNIYPVFAELAL